MKSESDVLVVDDSSVNRRFIGSLFQNKGISIIYATNGKEALEVVRKKMPDLILMDVVMPEMDGYEVCEKLKEAEGTKDIPIIFLTSKNQTEDLIKGFALGAVDYVNKPFKKEELVSRVLTHLELKKSRDIIEEQKKQLKLRNASILEHSKTVEILNNKLGEKNILLQEMITTKDRFFCIISHDLKGPLSNIISFADLILDGYDDFGKEKLLKIVSLLKDSTVTSINLLENLLEWARLQTGALKRNPIKIDICSLLKNVVHAELKMAKLKEQRLEIAGCKESFAYADESMLNTILRNLLSNAIKFTPNGGSIIIRSKEIVIESIGYVAIEVKDTGMGISKESLANLFKVDKNLSTRGTNGEKGTGLGLILCKEFIEMNYGSISVKSKHGEGSSFTFTIPVYTEKDLHGNGNLSKEKTLNI
jgi:signal transduction histidine kinase